MSSTTKAACEKLLRDAENSALCAVPTNEAELNRLRYLERRGSLPPPTPGSLRAPSPGMPCIPASKFVAPCARLRASMRTGSLSARLPQALTPGNPSKGNAAA